MTPKIIDVKSGNCAGQVYGPLGLFIGLDTSNCGNEALYSKNDEVLHHALKTWLLESSDSSGIPSKRNCSWFSEIINSNQLISCNTIPDTENIFWTWFSTAKWGDQTVINSKQKKVLNQIIQGISKVNLFGATVS